jgi:glycosyltransferase involved in cell wall biosynthesis
MQVYDRPASETLRLSDSPAARTAAPWAVFDPDWYRFRYPDAPDGSPDALLAWHLEFGQRSGHSPNRYFDEAWQRRAWPRILGLIEAGSAASAFDAWCRGGHAARQPHWLFDPNEYRNRYPAVTAELLAQSDLINLYHHYLSFGAAERRVGHPLFDPEIYLAELDPANAESAAPMPFRHYLLGLETGAPERRTSLLFDPDWYGKRYVEASLLVAAGQYRCLLEHYLCNDRQTEFEPSPWFSEAHYLRENPGLADAIAAGDFANGFAHFLAHGLNELRSPHPDLDLDWYAGRDIVRADIEAGRARDAFAHWIAIGSRAGMGGRAPISNPGASGNAEALYRRREAIVLPLYGRHRLDFTCRGTPTVSVIMAVSDDVAETMSSLASLRTQYDSTIELILIDRGSPESDLETLVAGATVLRFDTALTDAASRDAGLVCATTDAVLFLSPGVDLAAGAIGNARARLVSDPRIGAVGGRLVQPDGTLLEAGGIVWRDGGLLAYARGMSPLAAEANFARETDFCSTVFLLARRDVLSALPDAEPGLANTTHDAADLCARIARAGYRVMYEPDALAFLTRDPSRPPSDGQAAFAAAHGEYLAGHFECDPTSIVQARSPDRGQTRVLFAEDAIPLRRIGSGFVRSNDVLRAMAASGASVTVFPMHENRFPLSVVRAELPATVEAMHDLSAADFPGFIAARRGCYDLIWIARTHNLQRIHAALTGSADDEAASPIRDQGLIDHLGPALASSIIVDTEAVLSIRQAGQAELSNRDFDLDAALRREFRHLDAAADVVAVNDAEAAIIRAHYCGNLTVLGHAAAARPTPRSFRERTGILFVGAIHAADHPNHDGLVWFIEDVLPLIERALRWETRLTVAGYVAPDVSLDRFRDHPRVTLRGPVADLVPLYDSHRVFVAPARFAAGIPFKVHEAAAFGVPVVATSLLAAQLGWPDGEAIGAADATDPAGFAARVVALHRDADLWTRRREAALARVTAELDPEAFASRVRRLLRARDADLEAVDRSPPVG